MYLKFKASIFCICLLERNSEVSSKLYVDTENKKSFMRNEKKNQFDSRPVIKMLNKKELS